MSIVTLPCDFGRRAVSFDICGVYGDRIFLTDLYADWNGYASVSEAAEEVSRHCHADYGSKRVIYRNTSGRWYELVHENGAFKGLAPYRERFSFKIFAASLSRDAAAG